MFVAEISWQIQPDLPPDLLDRISYELLGSLYQNGQIMPGNYPIAKSGNSLRTFVNILETDALDLKYANQYVLRDIEVAIELGASRPQIQLIGESPGIPEGTTCNCEPDSYILCTNFIEHGSPVKCGTCFADIPLYHLPKTGTSDDYNHILSWVRDYQACDMLQMHCTTGERFGLRQMSDPNRSLSKEGRQICDRLTALTTKPTYYNLYRYKKRTTVMVEIDRKYPSCGGEWLLDEPWHRYDFRCDRCRLVSNIAP